MSLLKLRSSLLKFIIEFRLFGNDPESEFPAKSRDCSDLKLVMEGGIGPEKELDRRLRDWRLGREEREAGIGPKKLFPERSRWTSWVSLETSGERVPE